jgi:hypothetical protein
LIKKNQTIKIGKHFLTFADSESISIPDGYDTIVFDPPWEIEWHFPKHHWRHKFIFTDPQRMGDIITYFGAPTWVFVWDCISSWYIKGKPLKRIKMCFWYGPLQSFDDKKYMLPKKQKPKKVKNTRGEYWYEGGEKTRISELYAEPITKPRPFKHAKPIEWVTAIIGCCSADGAAIYDPYAGSGTTIIAAEKLNRICHAVENSHEMIDLILTRIENETKLEIEIPRE